MSWFPLRLSCHTTSEFDAPLAMRGPTFSLAPTSQTVVRSLLASLLSTIAPRLSTTPLSSWWPSLAGQVPKKPPEFADTLIDSPGASPSLNEVDAVTSVPPTENWTLCTVPFGLLTEPMFWIRAWNRTAIPSVALPVGGLPVTLVSTRSGWVVGFGVAVAVDG